MILTMKPPRDLSTENCPREFYCALGPTEILATVGGAYGPAPFIWEAYELDEANPVIEWPYEDTDEEIRESLNNDECDCTVPNIGEFLTSHESFDRGMGHRSHKRSRGTINFDDPIHFGSTGSQGMFGGDHFCTATIKCNQMECEFEAVMRLVLTKRWHDGYEDEALSIGGP